MYIQGKLNMYNSTCTVSELVQLKLNIGDSDGDSTPPEFRKWNSTL